MTCKFHEPEEVAGFDLTPWLDRASDEGVEVAVVLLPEIHHDVGVARIDKISLNCKREFVQLDFARPNDSRYR